jgi:hypothetical protein
LNFTGVPTGGTLTITRSYSGDLVTWSAQVSQVSLVNHYSD